jgi:hypothetical protein
MRIYVYMEITINFVELLIMIGVLIKLIKLVLHLIIIKWLKLDRNYHFIV